MTVSMNANKYIRSTKEAFFYYYYEVTSKWYCGLRTVSLHLNESQNQDSLHLAAPVWKKDHQK